MGKLTRICGPVMAAIITAASAAQANTPWEGFDRELHASTCNYFENRARFQDRGVRQTLQAHLADSCMLALRDLTSPALGSPYIAKRARLYLDQLTAFKSVVVSMNTEAFLARSAQASRAPVDLAAIMVSHSGEYLIARHMGVLDLYADWARASRVWRTSG